MESLSSLTSIYYILSMRNFSSNKICYNKQYFQLQGSKNKIKWQEWMKKKKTLQKKKRLLRILTFGQMTNKKLIKRVTFEKDWHKDLLVIKRSKITLVTNQQIRKDAY